MQPMMKGEFSEAISERCRLREYWLIFKEHNISFIKRIPASTVLKHLAL